MGYPGKPDELPEVIAFQGIPRGDEPSERAI
jgi:hypothetical protein